MEVRRQVGRAVVWAVWVGAVLCGVVAGASAQDASSPKTPNADTQVSDAALLKRADALEEKVALIRGLKPLGPIAKGVRSREELRAELQRKLREEYTKAEILAESRALARMGLLAEDADLEALVIELLTEQIAGYYDVDEGELNLMRDMDPFGQEVATAHELFHAIQDQHFTLKRVQGPEEGLAGTRLNPDRSMARSSLIEGDATVLMIDFGLYVQGVLPYGNGGSFIDNPAMRAMMREQMKTLGGQTDAPDSALAKAPRFLREELQFPYSAGTLFVMKVREGRTWASVDAIYADPPDSTEQILHPERYLKRDAPVLVQLDQATLRAAMPGGPERWRVIYNTVVGEFRTRLWLEEHLSPAALAQAADAQDGEALNHAAAADGWDGDRLLVLATPDQTALVQLSVWDSAKEAEEYAQAMGAMVQARYPDATPKAQQGKHGGGACFVGPREQAWVERWGAWVMYAEGLPVQAPGWSLRAFREAVWSARRAGAYPPVQAAKTP